jgi:hypothetical protein
MGCIVNVSDEFRQPMRWVLSVGWPLLDGGNMGHRRERDISALSLLLFRVMQGSEDKEFFGAKEALAEPK